MHDDQTFIDPTSDDEATARPIATDHPPFALLVNGIAIAQVPFEQMIDACAELMIHGGAPQCPFSVTATRLPEYEMTGLPWFTEPGAVIATDGHPLPPAHTATAETASLTASDLETRPDKPRRKAVVTILEPGSPLGSGFSVRPWPDHVRCVPSCLLRCALFAPVGSAGKRHRKPVKLVTPAGLEVSVRGPQLLESDLDTFIGVLHIVRREIEGSLVCVSMADLVAACGRTDGEKTREHLVRSLRRLASATVSVRETKYCAHYEGHLLQNLSIVRGHLRTVTFRVPAAFYELFAANKTYLDLSDRRNCAGRPVAGWLQAFLATHRHPLAYSKSLYRRLMGLRSTQFTFNRQLVKALKHLLKIGFLTEFTIDSHGNVHVVRKAISKKTKTAKS